MIGTIAGIDVETGRVQVRLLDSDLPGLWKLIKEENPWLLEDHKDKKKCHEDDAEENVLWMRLHLSSTPLMIRYTSAETGDGSMLVARAIVPIRGTQVEH